MALPLLTSEEAHTLWQCLVAAAEGPFFPDWEFQTLMGVTREEVRALAATWHDRQGEQESLETAASVLNNLLGYPHGYEKRLGSFVNAPVGDLSRLLDRLVAELNANDT